MFLLNAISPDTLGTAWARLIDTLVGGGARACWPTRCGRPGRDLPARQALADLLAAQRGYLDAILRALITGRRAAESQMRPLSRRARLARTTAESTVARSLSEPATRRIDAEQSQGMLAAMRRLIQAEHVLRLEVQDERPAPTPTRARAAGRGPRRHALERRGRAPGAAGGARSAAAGRAARSARALSGVRALGSGRCPLGGLLDELDEMVDAANSLAVLAGLDLADGDAGREAGAGYRVAVTVAG